MDSQIDRQLQGCCALSVGLKPALFNVAAADFPCEIPAIPINMSDLSTSLSHRYQVRTHSKPHPPLSNSASLSPLSAPPLPDAQDEYADLKSEYRDYLLTYRVLTCPDRCKDPVCKCYHPGQGQHQRRRPVRAPTGIWTYLPVSCLEPDCSDMDCPFSHSVTEYLFHPMVYKTKKCEQELTEQGICCKFGYHCPNIHIEKDGDGLPGFPYNLNVLSQNLPKLHDLESQKDYKSSIRTPLDTYIPSSQSRTNKIPPRDSHKATPPQLTRETYKVSPCPDSKCRKGERCIGYHRAEERRRQDDHLYSHQPCKFVYLSAERGFDINRMCPNGDLCKFAHTGNEVFFHRLMYRTKPCLNYLERASCAHPFCPFLHERRSATPVQSAENSCANRTTPTKSDIQRLRTFIQAASMELTRLNHLALCALCENESSYVYWCGHMFCSDCKSTSPSSCQACPACASPSPSPIRLVGT